MCVASNVFHVIWCLVYVSAGTIQFVAGVFFLVTLPIFKTGSNIWVGAWNILVGISCTIVSCVGELTVKKQETLLYCTFSVLAVNVVNLVLLEVGEWHFFMTDSVAAIVGQKNLRKLIFFAHMTTSVSTAIAILCSFLDSQLTFCWMQHGSRQRPIHLEPISDIEYIIPRSKSKQAQHNSNSQYAQSWVFEAETPGSSKTESPYLKLPTLTSKYDGQKTVTHLQLEEFKVVPTIHVPAGSRTSLNHMRSFSRTPSPMGGSDSSSSSEDLNPPIYECLERLTEPAIYRSRLNTAISLTAGHRHYSVSSSPMHMEGPLVRPRSETIAGNRLSLAESSEPGDKVQYASLMAELQQSFKSNAEKFLVTFSPESSDRSKTSEFSKELEAALQLIQDLESPNTVESASKVVCVKWQESEPSDSTKTLSENVSPSNHGKTRSQSTSGYSSPPSDGSSSTSTLVLTAQTQQIAHKGNTAIRSSLPPMPIYSISGDPILEECLDRNPESNPRNPDEIRRPWSAISRLTKRAMPPKLAPELEGAIYKPECLAYLSDLELIARHNRNKSTQREIEQRIHRQFLENLSSDSSC